MTTARPLNPSVETPDGPRRSTTGPLVAVLVVAVCLTIGLSFAWLVLRAVGADPDSPAGTGWGNVLGFAPAAALLGLWVVRREQRPFSALGLRGPGRVRRLLLGVGTAIVGLIVLNIVAGAVASGSEQEGGGALALPQALLLLVTFAVQAPTEELLFRGFLLPVLCRRWGMAAGVLLTSALFGLAHLINPAAPPVYALLTFLLGLALAMWTLADGNLWRACAFHTVWNWAPTAFGGGGDGNASGLDAATVTSVACVLALLAACALWSLRRSLRRG
ncbi:CPBP family intramembrane metalloprotease [Streptomyces sp. XM4193]|uniref:CPBP family intramembrane glutamic endopeptidase n=1 Tax=Streptomyces sp. XM4193 TaxID=2929782 RepID=UPI001FF83BA9|nr:type II CAAX endopeptidase family protein [Streptomyces sp. XM4193]MCK1794462.1 CPBP family intramembrane metalloprotease [Streptomyces sp. XM4193]